MKKFVELVKNDFVAVDRITNVKIMRNGEGDEARWGVFVFVDYNERGESGISENSVYNVGDFAKYGGALVRAREVLAEIGRA